MLRNLLFFGLILLYCTHAQAHLPALPSLQTDVSRPGQAAVLVSDSLGQAIHAGDTRRVIDLQVAMARIRLRQGYIDSAMTYVFRAQSLILQLPGQTDSMRLGRCYQLLGDIFYARYMEHEAISQYSQALICYRGSACFTGIAEILRALSDIHMGLGMQNYAAREIDMLLFIKTRLNDTYISAVADEAFGDYLSSSGKPRAAIREMKNSLALYQAAGNRDKVSDVMLNIALAYGDMAKTDSALVWADTAMSYNSRYELVRGYYEALYYRAVFLSGRDPGQAVEILLAAIPELGKQKLMIHQGIYLKLLTSIYKTRKDYFNALQSTERFHEVINQIYGSDAERKIAGLQLEVESQKLSHQIASMQRQQEMITIEARSHRNMLFFFTLAMAILIAMALNNMRRLQYRLYLLKEFSLDNSFAAYIIYFFTGLVYFSFLLMLISPFRFTGIPYLTRWLHCGALGGFASVVLMAGIIILPAHWSAKPGFNRRFTFTGIGILLLMNLLLGLYAVLAGLISFSVYDILNLSLVLMGLTIVPVFFVIVFLEKVLLRKHTQMAGMLNNRIHRSARSIQQETVTLYSEKAKDSLTLVLDTILCIEAQGNYSKIYFTESGKLKTAMILASLKLIEEQLGNHKHFIRCHKSFIVNLGKISKVMGNSHGYKLNITSLDQPVPVSRTFTEHFIKSLDSSLKGQER